jgi:hypothetical protein
MAKATVKISFDDQDPLYRFLVAYGERFGHGGSSVTARLMLDQAFQSAPSLNPFEGGSVQRPVQESQPGSAGEIEGDQTPPPEARDTNRQDLLSAINDFQSKL